MPSQVPSTIHLQVALPFETLTESEKRVIIMNLDDSSHSSLRLFRKCYENHKITDATNWIGILQMQIT